MLDSIFKDKVKGFVCPSTKKIAVAVSGGADSMCLVHLAHKHLDDIEVHAVIIDHDLRIESADEALLVAKRLNSMGITNTIIKWQGDKPSSNVQEHARNARYDLLSNFCRSNSIDTLLVGHNLNDQAETVMMRIMRGSGVDGIAAIPSSTTIKNIRVYRPLLDVLREDIEAYLRANKIKWVNDPSNKNEKYDRVKIRNFINALPDKETWIQRLALLAGNAQRSADFINSQLETVFAKHVKFENLGYAHIDYKTFLELHDEIALKLLVKIIECYSAPSHQPRLRSLETVLQNLRDKRDAVLGGIEFKTIKDRIYFLREFTAINVRVIDGTWDYRIKVSDSKTEFKPLGKNGWAKIKNNVGTKNWPHINVVYALPAIFHMPGEISCPALGVESP